MCNLLFVCSGLVLHALVWQPGVAGTRVGVCPLRFLESQDTWRRRTTYYADGQGNGGRAVTMTGECHMDVLSCQDTYMYAGRGYNHVAASQKMQRCRHFLLLLIVITTSLLVCLSILLYSWNMILSAIVMPNNDMIFLIDRDTELCSWTQQIFYSVIEEFFFVQRIK